MCDDRRVNTLAYEISSSERKLTNEEIKTMLNDALEKEQFEIVNLLAQKYPHLVNTKLVETQLWESPKTSNFIFNIFVKESEKNLAPTLKKLNIFFMEDLKHFESYLLKLKQSNITEPQYFVLQKHGPYDGHCLYGKIDRTNKHNFNVEFKESGSLDKEDAEIALETVKKYFSGISHSSLPKNKYH